MGAQIMGPIIKGTFNISTRNVITGETHCYNTMQNLFLNSGIDWLVQYGITYGSVAIYFGSGTTEPQVTDTALSAYLWSVNASLLSSNIDGLDTSASVTYKAAVPASDSYVGTIAEIGMYGYSYNQSKLLTHSLLKDAEGQAITVEKTALIELTVEYTLTVMRNGEKHNPYFSLLTSTALLYGTYAAGLGPLSFAGEYMRVVDGIKVFYRPVSWSLSKQAAAGTYSAANKQITYSGVRALATQLNVTYVHALIISQTYNFVGINPIIDFPDASILPVYTLEGMQVGIGDGTTTSFEPPLDFWLKDSEEIFIDGVKQTRGVDYTADHYNNLHNLTELNPTTAAIPVAGEIIKQQSTLIPLTTYNSNGISSSFRNYYNFPATLYRYKSSTSTDFFASFMSNCAFGLSAEKPLIIELLMDADPARDWAIDTWILSRIQPYSGTRYTFTTLLIEYADSLEGPWTEFLTATSVPYSTIYSDSDYYSTDHKSYTGTQAVTAKYWRFTPPNGTGTPGAYNSIMLCGYRAGHNIVFTNPPAADAVITMNAQLDRPLKNNKHVIDWNPVIQF